MTTPKTDALMALADRYAFHIPGSQHSDEARAALLAALQEQAREMEMARENAVLRVTLCEMQEVTNWAYGTIADKLGGAL